MSLLIYRRHFCILWVSLQTSLLIHMGLFWLDLWNDSLFQCPTKRSLKRPIQTRIDIWSLLIHVGLFCRSLLIYMRLFWLFNLSYLSLAPWGNSDRRLISFDSSMSLLLVSFDSYGSLLTLSHFSSTPYQNSDRHLSIVAWQSSNRAICLFCRSLLIHMGFFWLYHASAPRPIKIQIDTGQSLRNTVQRGP